MAVLLLDVNVLMALVWPTHLHHEAAHQWFAGQGRCGWATCPITQFGFLRLSLQPAVVKMPITFGDALDALVRSTASEHHSFLPADFGVAAIRDEIRSRIVGHNQLTDALLLELAIRQGARLATFDRQIHRLLPAERSWQDSVELIAC